MANQVSAYQVADSAEGKRGSINAWTPGGTGERNLVDLKTGIGNYVEKDEAPIDIDTYASMCGLEYCQTVSNLQNPKN